MDAAGLWRLDHQEYVQDQVISGLLALDVDCHLEEVVVEQHALVVVQAQIALEVEVQEHADEAEAVVHVDAVVPEVGEAVVDRATTAAGEQHTSRPRLTILHLGVAVSKE
jgi:hypothetical protein